MLAFADCATAVERQVIDDWLSGHHPHARLVVMPTAGHGTPNELARLDRILDQNEGRQVMPLRVAWLPAERGGARRAKLSDVLPGRNPYRPPASRQKGILARQPDRVRVIVGESATVHDLRRQWITLEAAAEPGTAQGSFADFVTRRAALALESAQSRVLGPEYKSPQLVKEELLTSARFRSGVERVTGSTMHAVQQQVETILDELVTGWGPLFVDVIPLLGRLMYRRGFDAAIDYDEKQIVRTRETVRHHSTITLMSHRSNLDAGILAIAMRENGLPLAHGFAGINMAFPPIGPIMRRAGVIFIRRDIGKDPLYKYILRAYVGYLIEKRFNLHWSIEGTRSRTGKMLPPRLGLLSYVAEAFIAAQTDDVLLLPTSISFDQLHEIGEYASYARGGEKQPEGLGWLVRFARAQGERHFGKVYVRYGEPVSMRHYLGSYQADAPQPGSGDPHLRLALHKMAFEVAWRINHATPVSGTALVTTMLLASHGRAWTLPQLRRTTDRAVRYLKDRDVPLTRSAEALASDAGVRATLDALSNAGGPVTKYDGGEVTVWAIEGDHQLAAAFYRNSIIHFFLERSICELALHAAQASEANREDRFWDQALELRDLLKFDFYFQERDEYLAALTTEMERADPDWTAVFGHGPAKIDDLLRRMQPMTSSLMLRPFLEAYGIVADVLAKHPDVDDEAALVNLALGLGRQYRLQGRISSDEPVSVLLFRTALKLGRNKGLLDPGADTAPRRQEFAEQVHAILRDLRNLDRRHNLPLPWDEAQRPSDLGAVP